MSISASPGNMMACLVELAPFGKGVADTDGVMSSGDEARDARGEPKMMSVGAVRKLVDVPWKPTRCGDGKEISL